MKPSIGSFIRTIRTATKHVRAFAPTGAALASVLIMVLAPSVEALQLQLVGEGYNLRTPDGEKLVASGVLAKGSVLQIPDEYKVNYDGNLNLEATVINWLRKSQAEPSHQDAKSAADTARAVPGSYAYEMNGKEGHADFYPVNVVQAAPGSTIPPTEDGQKVFVSLLHMVRSGSVLVVDEDTPALVSERVLDNAKKFAAEKAAKDAAAKAAAEKRRAANPGPAPVTVPNPADPGLAVDGRPTQGVACPGGCGTTSQNPISAAALHNYISIANRAIANQSNATRIPIAGPTLGSPIKEKDLNEIRRTIHSTCRDDKGQPVQPDEFINQLKAGARANGMPENLLVNMMIHESAGNCIRPGGDGEIGPLQIKPVSSGFAICKDAGRAAECKALLRNPKTAIQAAVNLFADNARILLKPNNPNGFDPRSLSIADKYRLLTMAYNRGGGTVLAAKASLDRWNARNNSQLKAEKWNEFRPFIMAAYLEGRTVDIKSVVRGIHYPEAMVPI